MLNEKRKHQLEQREWISLSVEVGNTRPSRFHLKVAEMPAADALLETKEQQQMKWCLKHWGTTLSIYLVCLNTDQINAHMQGMYAHLQICSIASCSTAGGMAGLWRRVVWGTSVSCTVTVPLWWNLFMFYVKVDASPVAVPFYDHQQNAGIHALWWWSVPFLALPFSVKPYIIKGWFAISWIWM